MTSVTTNFATLLAATLLVSACGGGGGSGGGSPGTGGSGSTQVTGAVASGGLVINAVVTAKCLSSNTTLGSATTDASGNYSIAFNATCPSTEPILLTASPQSTTTVADMVWGSRAIHPSASETWALRAYVVPTANATTTQPITLVTDMVVAVANAVVGFTGTATVTDSAGAPHSQSALPLSAGLLAEAKAAIANIVFNGDPGGILSALPIPDASATLTTSWGQMELMEFMVTASVTGSPAFAPGTNFDATASTTCQDTVACGSTTTASELALMEQSITVLLGAQLFVGDTSGSSVLLPFVPTAAYFPDDALWPQTQQIEYNANLTAYPTSGELNQNSPKFVATVVPALTGTAGNAQPYDIDKLFQNSKAIIINTAQAIAMTF